MARPRFDVHQLKAGQKGGIQLYPVDGKVSGCSVSDATLNNSVQPPTLNVIVTSGELIMDGQQILVQQVSSKVLSRNVNDSFNGSETLSVFVTPKRFVKTYTTLPDYTTHQDGDLVIKVYEVGDHYQVAGFYRRGTVGWISVDNVKDSSLNGNHNWLPYNQIDSETNYDAEDLSLYPEKTIYHKRVSPPYVQQPSSAYLRASASVELAQVDLQLINNTVTVEKIRNIF